MEPWLVVLVAPLREIHGAVHLYLTFIFSQKIKVKSPLSFVEDKGDFAESTPYRAQFGWYRSAGDAVAWSGGVGRGGSAVLPCPVCLERLSFTAGRVTGVVADHGPRWACFGCFWPFSVNSRIPGYTGMFGFSARR